jgi:Ankyrin repeats (3 copies)
MTAVDSLQASLPILALQHQRYHVLLLLARWGDLGQKDNKGCGLPHWAAYKGDVDALRLLHLWAGQDMRGADKQGMTPLHRAAQVGAESGCQFLITKCYVDPAAKNHENETASDCAKKVGRAKLGSFIDQCVDKRSLVGKQLEDGGRSLAEVQPRVDEVVQSQKNLQWVMPCMYVVIATTMLLTALLELADHFPTTFIVCLVFQVPLYGYLVFSDSGRKHRRRVGQTAIEELQSQLERIANNTLPDNEERNEIAQICLTCMD